MNKKMILLTAIVIFSGFVTAEEITQPQISVYGTAEIKVVPNEMVWSLNVNTKDKDLVAVSRKQMFAVEQALGFLKEMDIEQEKLQTSQMRFGENWKTVNNERVQDGYYASTNISFVISDFELYQQIWFGLAAIKNVTIESTSYTHSDRIKYQNESRQKAVLVAREKAIALAATLGSGIAEPLAIEEMASQVYAGSNMISNSVNYDSTVSADVASGDVLALGTISINTRVRVVFKLKNP